MQAKAFEMFALSLKPNLYYLYVSASLKHSIVVTLLLNSSLLSAMIEVLPHSLSLYHQNQTLMSNNFKAFHVSETIHGSDIPMQRI